MVGPTNFWILENKIKIGKRNKGYSGPMVYGPSPRGWFTSHSVPGLQNRKLTGGVHILTTQSMVNQVHRTVLGLVHAWLLTRHWQLMWHRQQWQHTGADLSTQEPKVDDEWWLNSGDSGDGEAQ